MNQDFGNWRKWITERFGDTSKFQIHIDKDKIKYTIVSSDDSINTKIYFYFMHPEDDEVLYDIHFTGGQCIWLSPFTNDPVYKPKSRTMATSLYLTEEFVKRLEDEWLSIPLKKGWEEQNTYLGDKIYKSKLKIQDNKSDNWDIIQGNPFDISLFDELKALVGLGLSNKTIKYPSIEK